MGGTFDFPGKMFGGKIYACYGVYLSGKSAQESAAKLRGQGWLVRVAPARRDTKGKRRVGYLGVYKRRP